MCTNMRACATPPMTPSIDPPSNFSYPLPTKIHSQAQLFLQFCCRRAAIATDWAYADRLASDEVVVDGVAAGGAAAGEARG